MFAAPSAFPVGGLGSWLDTLLPDLETLGWETWLAIPHGRHSDADAYERIHPWPRCVRFQNYTGTRIGALNAVNRVIDQIRPELVVVANLAYVIEAIAQRRASCRSSPRLAVSIHTLDPGIFADLHRNCLVVDSFIGTNRLTIEAGARLCAFDSTRSYYAPYGVDIIDHPEPYGNEWALKIVVAGRMEQVQKRVFDVPLIVDSISRMGITWELDLAGAGPDASTLMYSLARHVEIGRVRWHGILSPSEVRKRLLMPGSILLLTSEWETGPIIAWEAMAQGAVVVCPPFIGCGLENALRDEETALFFRAGDAADAARVIARLADPLLRHKLSTAGWDMVRQRYARPVAAHAWDRALRNTLQLPELPRLSKLPESQPAGRLDRALGVRAADRLRRVLHMPVVHTDSGSEWPHTHGGGMESKEFFDTLARLDSGGTVLRTRYVSTASFH